MNLFCWKSASTPIVYFSSPRKTLVLFLLSQCYFLRGISIFLPRSWDFHRLHGHQELLAGDNRSLLTPRSLWLCRTHVHSKRTESKAGGEKICGRQILRSSYLRSSSSPLSQLVSAGANSKTLTTLLSFNEVRSSAVVSRAPHIDLTNCQVLHRNDYSETLCTHPLPRRCLQQCLEFIYVFL